MIGGQIVTPQEWPGIFYTTQDGSRCTGTLVGSRVVASAAHCMDNGASLTLTYNGADYTGTCTHSPDYAANWTADWALCLLDRAIPDAIAESVNTDSSRLTVGYQLTLMGFGCIYSGGSGGNDGWLRKGQAPIRGIPSEADANYDIVTEGYAALCYGDSGGPSFYIDTATGRRYQTGINSRGDIARTSYMSSVSASAAQDFYRSWSAANGVTICGLDAAATGCRDGGGTPPDPTLPFACKTAASSGALDVLKRCTGSPSDPAQAQCVSALATLKACIDARG